MTAIDDDPAPSATLIGRHAGSAVIVRCLAEQAHEPSRRVLQRVFGVDPLGADARSWYAGALGELRVARRLDRLGDGWRVLHAVPVGSGESDIDHVVVGPAGVFTINTKHHDGARVWVGAKRILVNGQPTDHVRNAEHESARATRLLREALGEDVPVRSAIVIVGARELTIRQQPAAVEVMTDQRLLSWLRTRRATTIDVDAVAAVVSRPDTWHASGVDAIAHPDLDGFTALRDEVDQAHAIRSLWIAAAGFGTAAVALALSWPAMGSLFGW